MINAHRLARDLGIWAYTRTLVAHRIAMHWLRTGEVPCEECDGTGGIEVGTRYGWSAPLESIYEPCDECDGGWRAVP